MRNRLFPVALLSVLSLLALALTFINLRQALPLAQWQQAMFAPDIDNIRQVVFHYSLLSRLALLVGAGLGLAGLLFQQVLRNPLAEPTTLGVSSGAQLGLTVATLWQLPGGELTQQFAAMGGAVLVGVLVFGIAWGKRLSPVTLILAGLVLSLYAGAVNQIFAIFNHDQLQNMFLWSTGALNQLDGHNVALLWPRLLLAFALALAILLSAQLVNVAGIIGFIGLFASLLAKMLGARRLLSRLLLAPLIGALLLWLADQCVLWLTAHWREVSTGTATALIGVPILLWLLPRLRTGSLPPAMNAGDTVSQERQAVLRWCLAGVMILALCSLAGIAFGRDAHGWTWVSGDMLQQLLPWRVPRVLAALVVGMMLGVAGVLIQRLTVNPMASPEVLGISSGAACGGWSCCFFVPGNVVAWLLPAGVLGAALTLLVIMLVASRGGFAPERMLLAGMALNSAFVTLLMVLLASGDPRMAGLLSWISGSTYNISMTQALQSAVVGMILVALAPLASRWLTLLPLGGGLLVFADWCGRMLAFPDQIPAGLMATFFGAPYFIWLLRRA
ncbi:transporter permease [Plautia stali symbiont]|nr:transporter permease [Plautia stali symbiont]